MSTVGSATDSTTDPRDPRPAHEDAPGDGSAGHSGGTDGGASARRGPFARLRHWLDASIMRKSLAALVPPLLLIGVALVAITRLEDQTARAEEDVRQTLQVLSDLHEAHSLLAETAAAVRGYRLVRRDNFLDPYRLSEPRLPALLDRLEANLTDPRQRASMGRVRPLFDEKSRGWRELLTPGIDPAVAERQLIEGKAKLDILRAELRRMREYETTQLERRARIAQQVRQRNLVITQIAALLAGLGAALSVAWFTSGLARRARQLAAEAARLGEGRALHLAGSGRDELGQVGARLVEASRLLAQREAETRRAREDAEEANRAKTDFLSRSSHELRTPLNAILGYAQVLALETPAPAQRAHVERILSAGRHLLGLISELLDIARIEAGRLDLALEAVPVRRIVDEAAALVAPYAQTRGIRLDLPADDALAVVADVQRLRQVLVNLLSNAVKFNREGGAVRIGTRALDGRVRLAVHDEGPGVPEGLRDRLFVPFERLGAERSAVEGTGLGLALSRRLAEAMDGEIGFDSTPGHGACFWVELPGAQHADDTAAPRHPHSAPAPTRPRTVLSVEDNASNRALIDVLLARRPQWTLQHAEHLAGARAVLEAAAVGASGVALPDLILLDLHLPDGRGETWIAELRADPRFAGIAVVAVSADATERTVQAARAAGALDVLAKPLDVSRFFATLDRALA